MQGPRTTEKALDLIERQFVDVFADGVKVLGLPGSVGEIYGLLYCSKHPHSMDDIVNALNISKGSASQGIRTLKALGAVREAEAGTNGERRAYYEASVELKRLVGGFIREQIQPHLSSGKTKISHIAENLDQLEDAQRAEFLQSRLDRLEQWMRTGGRLLPFIQKMLGQ